MFAEAGGTILVAACADGSLLLIDGGTMVQIACFERAADLPTVLVPQGTFAGDADGPMSASSVIEIDAPVADADDGIDADLLCVPLDEAYFVEVEDSLMCSDREAATERMAATGSSSSYDADAAVDRDEDDDGETNDDDDDDDDDECTTDVFLVLFSGGADVAAYRLMPGSRLEAVPSPTGTGVEAGSRSRDHRLRAVSLAESVIESSHAARSGACLQPWTERSVVAEGGSAEGVGSGIGIGVASSNL